MDWYTVLERWHWSPESIGNLDLEDLFRHAEIVRAFRKAESEAQTPSRPTHSSNGRRLVSADAFTTT